MQVPDMRDSDNVEQLFLDVEAYAEKHKGQIYAPIDHPRFASVPFQHGPERFAIIKPHLPSEARTALDVGTHWGYFAHLMEKAGYKVTAAELLPEYHSFLYRIRALYNDEFEIWPKSVFEIPQPDRFDVIIALNIFHHFIKTQSMHQTLIEFLGKLDCKAMFFQSHSVREGQMQGAYRNYAPEEFCEFIIQNSNLSQMKKIGDVKSRPMFKIF